MKILVLGSEGQIGNPFSLYATSKGHTVIRWDKKLSASNNLALHPSGLDGVDFDVCVFLAFEVGGSKFLEKADKTLDYISENVRLMDYTFEQLSKRKKPFLFASSQMALMHNTNYGFLKDLGERYTKAIGGHICRFWNVYGYENPSDPKSHVITDFIHMAKKGKIKMLTDGLEERQFLHVDDCSVALLNWCEKYEEYSKSEYIDITSFNWLSIKSIADVISSIIPCSVEVGERKDSIQLGIKNTPTEYVLRFWQPKISIEEGIKKLI
jgi:nucleoside-diphosphate-sugar epimerase